MEKDKYVKYVIETLEAFALTSYTTEYTERMVVKILEKIKEYDFPFKIDNFMEIGTFMKSIKYHFTLMLEVKDGSKYKEKYDEICIQVFMYKNKNKPHDITYFGTKDSERIDELPPEIEQFCLDICSYAERMVNDGKKKSRKKK